MNFRISFIAFVLALVFIGPALPSTEAFKTGSQSQCYVHKKKASGKWTDEIWFCGKHTQYCETSDKTYTLDGKDTPHSLYHKQSFTYGGKTYWCCDGTTEKIGQFIEGKSWIVESKTETFTENVNGGKCTWKQKWNICGVVDEAQTEKVCTEADPGQGCAAGYVARINDQKGVRECVPECADGYVFKEGSNKCVQCETTNRQAVVNGNCRICELNEILDKQTMQCMTVQEVAVKKLQISAIAHDTCWLCASPDTLLKCLKHVTNGGRIADDAELVSKCSLNSTND